MWISSYRGDSRNSKIKLIWDIKAKRLNEWIDKGPKAAITVAAYSIALSKSCNFIDWIIISKSIFRC